MFCVWVGILSVGGVVVGGVGVCVVVWWWFGGGCVWCFVVWVVVCGVWWVGFGLFCFVCLWGGVFGMVLVVLVLCWWVVWCEWLCLFGGGFLGVSLVVGVCSLGVVGDGGMLVIL